MNNDELPDEREQMQMWFDEFINARLKALTGALRQARTDDLAAEISQEIDVLMEIESNYILVHREEWEGANDG